MIFLGLLCSFDVLAVVFLGLFIEIYGSKQNKLTSRQRGGPIYKGIYLTREGGGRGRISESSTWSPSVVNLD